MKQASNHLRTSRLDNGLEIITERNPSQRSASVIWLVPGGSACDPLDRGDGWGTLLSEYLMRGSGEHDSRGFSDAMDRLGMRRSVSADTYHQHISATLAGSDLRSGLDRLVDLVRHPRFPEEALAPVKSLCLQELSGLEDDPASFAAVRLDEIRYPSPFHRHGLGIQQHIEATTPDDLRGHWEEVARPSGSILAIAGDVDHDRVVEQLSQKLADWTGTGPTPSFVGEPVGGTLRIERDTSQVHLGIGLEGPIAADPDHLAFRTAVGVLGGGSSSRLFLDVRERRGLAYSVSARYSEGFALGSCTISAGTTPERVAETLERIDAVLEEFDDGPPTDEEVRRIAVGLRSGGLMQQEHGPSRARQLALDVFRRGTARSTEAILSEFDAIDADDVRRVASERMGPAWRSAAIRCLLGPASAIVGSD
jgi:predicted Zn-dependent peptidase